MFLAGCCRQCFAAQTDDEPNAKSPLLIGVPSAGNFVKRQPSSARPQRRQLNNNNVNNDEPRKVDIVETQVNEVDKRMQDHGELYNDFYDKYQDVERHMVALHEAFPEENPEKSLKKALSVIKIRSGGDINVQRKQKYCMLLHYSDLQADGLTREYMKTFNDVNQLIKDITDKGPKLKSAITLVLKDEREFRRDVLAASLGANGPDSMKNCIEGIAELKLVSKFIDVILVKTKKIFDELLLATKVVCEESVTVKKVKVKNMLDASLSMNTDESSDNC